MVRSNSRYYKNRVPELDLLRGAAILLVLLRHYPIVFGFRQCWIGVDIFFTLSGFLVAGLLIREYQEKGKVRIGRFLIRRGLKIYPSFYFFLFTTVGLAWVLKFAGKPIFFPVLDLQKFLVEVVYLQSLVSGLWWHTWSLAVEEHFYFLLALIVLVLAGSRIRKSFISWLLGISLVFIPLCIGLRFATAAKHPEFSYILHYNNTFLRLDSLFFGVIIACLYYGYSERLKKWPAWTWFFMTASGLTVLMGWLMIYPLESIQTAKLGFTVIYAGFGMVMFGMLGIRFHSNWSEKPGVSRNLLFRSMLLMGRNSYNIYLWHAFVLETMILLIHSLLGKSMFDPMTIPFFIIYFVASIFMGSLVTGLLEIPVLKWRDRKYKAAARITG